MGTFVLNQKPIQSINVTYTGLRDEDFTCEDEIKSQQFCQQGQSVIGFDKDGSMICGSAVESKTCQAGYVVKGIRPDGSVICGKDLDSKINSKTCLEGKVVTGIDNNGSVICGKDLDSKIKSKTCLEGRVVTGIDDRGKVICEFPQPKLDISKFINCKLITPEDLLAIKAGTYERKYELVYIAGKIEAHQKNCYKAPPHPGPDGQPPGSPR